MSLFVSFSPTPPHLNPQDRPGGRGGAGGPRGCGRACPARLRCPQRLWIAGTPVRGSRRPKAVSQNHPVSANSGLEFQWGWEVRISATQFPLMPASVPGELHADRLRWPRSRGTARRALVDHDAPGLRFRREQRRAQLKMGGQWRVPRFAETVCTPQVLEVTGRAGIRSRFDRSSGSRGTQCRLRGPASGDPGIRKW